jgi:hypothetical protein
VEIGQLLALSTILIVMSYWRRTDSFAKHAYTADVAVMCTGFVRMGYQLTGFFVSEPPDQVQRRLQPPAAPRAPEQGDAGEGGDQLVVGDGVLERPVLVHGKDAALRPHLGQGVAAGAAQHQAGAVGVGHQVIERRRQLYEPPRGDHVAGGEGRGSGLARIVLRGLELLQEWEGRV